MEISLVFGHSGTPVLVFPSSMGRFHEWETFHMISALRRQIEEEDNQSRYSAWTPILD